jgi:hypothetical protein
MPFGPDPLVPFPVPSQPSMVFLKPTITNPQIEVGDYTYYHSFDDPLALGRPDGAVLHVDEHEVEPRGVEDLDRLHGRDCGKDAEGAATLCPEGAKPVQRFGRSLMNCSSLRSFVAQGNPSRCGRARCSASFISDPGR